MVHKDRADQGVTLHLRRIKALIEKGESGEEGKNILNKGSLQNNFSS